MVAVRLKSKRAVIHPTFSSVTDRSGPKSGLVTFRRSVYAACPVIDCLRYCILRLSTMPAESLPTLTFPSVSSAIPTPFHGPLRSLLIRALQLLPLPKHVAFIMDGNRRAARVKGERVIKGHERGFDALKGVSEIHIGMKYLLNWMLLQLLEFLLALNVPNVTVYAFAMDNFSRSQDEVDGLMDLAARKLLELSEKGNLLDLYGVRINVIGRKEMLPPELQRAIRHVETTTRGNNR